MKKCFLISILTFLGLCTQPAEAQPDLHLNFYGFYYSDPNLKYPTDMYGLTLELGITEYLSTNNSIVVGTSIEKHFSGLQYGVSFYYPLSRYIKAGIYLNPICFSDITFHGGGEEYTDWYGDYGIKFIFNLSEKLFIVPYYGYSTLNFNYDGSNPFYYGLGFGYRFDLALNPYHKHTD